MKNKTRDVTVSLNGKPIKSFSVGCESIATADFSDGWLDVELKFYPESAEFIKNNQQHSDNL